MSSKQFKQAKSVYARVIFEFRFLKTVRALHTVDFLVLVSTVLRAIDPFLILYSVTYILLKDI